MFATYYFFFPTIAATLPCDSSAFIVSGSRNYRKPSKPFSGQINGSHFYSALHLRKSLHRKLGCVPYRVIITTKSWYIWYTVPQISLMYSPSGSGPCTSRFTLSRTRSPSWIPNFFSQPFILQLYVVLLFSMLLNRIYSNGISSSIPSGIFMNPSLSVWLVAGGRLSPADFLLSANSCSSTTTSVV